MKVVFVLLLTLAILPGDTEQSLARNVNGRLNTQAQKPVVVPDEFKHVNFKTSSYQYKFSSGKRMNIALKDGEYEYKLASDRGWFNLSDVYYVDLTNDKRPEAIVMLWHVSCGTSCDGGAALFYIYSVQGKKLRSLWQYETGSLAYGCGLKSFATEAGKITLELFGKCFSGNDQSTVPGKFQVKDLTRLTFKSNGRKFVARRKELMRSSESSVKNYEPKISINE